MSVREAHTPYHPRWHRTRPSTYWWLERPAYFAFILREVSSVFVAWFVAYLVKLLWALAHGSGAYGAFLRLSSHPLVVLLNVVTFFFVTFHAVTWLGWTSNCSASCATVRSPLTAASATFALKAGV